MDREKFISARRDLALSSLLIIIAIVAIMTVDFTASRTTAASEVFTHATMPLIYSIGLMIISIGIAVPAVIKIVLYKEENTVESSEGEQGTEKASSIVVIRFFATAIMLVLFALFLGKISLFIETVLFLAIMFVLFGQRNPLKIAIISLIGGAAFHFLFVSILKLPF
jgi:hypothetical protein